jgi:N6-adenosine-specific RNA methylase IME4
MGKALVVSRKSWAERIAKAWQSSLVGIFESGRLIAASKESLDHGEFLGMITDDLPFCARTAQRLMAIAADDRLTDATHVSHLPPHWGTLYELTKMSNDVFDASIIDGTINPEMQRKDVGRELKEIVRETRRIENRAKVAGVPNALATDVKFPTIVIDCPWDWGDEGDQDQLGRARPDYGTMTIEQLMEFSLVSDHADVDCHLYMWITNRSLPKGFALLDRWGFRYVTMLTWNKPSYGMGNYFRGQTEHILFGVKGSQMLKRKDIGTSFNWPRGPNGHSSKPLEMYEMVESASPGPYLEIFSRHDRADWTSWGENSVAAAA